MWLEIPHLWIGLINGLGIPAFHLGLSWAFTRMPERWFESDGWLFRRWPGETSAGYERTLGIRRWKRWLPDAAPWFGGIPKRSLAGAGAGHLRAMIRETRRGEAAHHAQTLVIAAFVLWTPWPWAAVILAWALVSNLPCVWIQRYNRLRFRKRLGGLDARRGFAPGGITRE